MALQADESRRKASFLNGLTWIAGGIVGGSYSGIHGCRNERSRHLL